VSSRVKELSAQRAHLQARCRLERDEVRRQYRGIEQRTARADRVIETAREYAPVIAVAGIAVLLLLGPGRMLRLLGRGLRIALYANQAMRIMR